MAKPSCGKCKPLAQCAVNGLGDVPQLGWRYRNRHTRTRQRSVLLPATAATGLRAIRLSKRGMDVRRIGPFRVVFVSRTEVLLLEDGAHGMAAHRTTQSRAAFASPIEETVLPAGPSSRASVGGVQDLGSGVASLQQARLLLKLQDQP